MSGVEGISQVGLYRLVKEAFDSKVKATKNDLLPGGGKAVAANKDKVTDQNYRISSSNLGPGYDINGNFAAPYDPDKVDTTKGEYTSGAEMEKTRSEYWDLVGSFFLMFPGMFSMISTGYFDRDGKLRGIREAVFNSLVLEKDGKRITGKDLANQIKEVKKEDLNLVYVDLNTLYDQLAGMGLRFSKTNFIKMIGEGESRIKLPDFNSNVEYLSNYFNGTGHSPAEYAYLGLISDKLTGKEHFRINYAHYNEGDGGACAKLHLENPADMSNYLAEMEVADPTGFAMAKSLSRADGKFAKANGIVINEDERTLYWLTVLYQEALIGGSAARLNIPTAKFYTADFAPGGKHYESFNIVLKQYMESGGKFLPIGVVNDWFKIGDSQKAPNRVATKNSMSAEKKDDTNKIEQDKKKADEEKKAEEEKAKKEQEAQAKRKEYKA